MSIILFDILEGEVNAATLEQFY